MARTFYSGSALPVLDVHARPQGCRECEYGAMCSGFIPTWMPPNPKVAFLLEAGSHNEIEDKEPLTGGTGRYFNHLLHRLGYTRGDVLLDLVIRGCPPEHRYPTGLLRKQAENRCRQYDGVHGTSLLAGGLSDYPADCMIFSVHPQQVLRSQNMNPLLVHKIGEESQGVLAKAFRLSAQGRRPVVLMGDKAKELVAPEFRESITKWIGHIQPLEPGEWRRRLGAVGMRDDLGRWWQEVKGIG